MAKHTEAELIRPFASFPQGYLERSGKMKGLFVHEPKGKSLYVEDVLQIAKNEAKKMGFSKSELIRTLKCEYDVRLRGWMVIIQSLW